MTHSHFTINPKLFLILSLVSILVFFPNVSAATYPDYFSPPINPAIGYNATDVVHVNQSYILNTSPGIPLEVWFFIGVLGIILLLLSFVLSVEQCNDIVSIMAWFPLILAAYHSTAIDIVTGYGVSGALDNQLFPAVANWVMLENHTIYSFNDMALLFLAFFVIAIFNTYRIWVNNRRLKNVIEGEDDE